MTRRFIDAPTANRCTATVTLKDGSTAQCGRHQKCAGLCTQHAKILAKQPPRFSVETLGLRRGAGWFGIVEVPDDHPETVRAMLHAQGWRDETIVAREWRLVPLNG